MSIKNAVNQGWKTKWEKNSNPDTSSEQRTKGPYKRYHIKQLI